MKRLVLFSLFGALTTLSLARENYTPVNGDGSIRTRLCDYWRYDFEQNLYGCGFIGGYVNLVTAKRHEGEVAKLENRIADLERRLLTLEEKR